MRIPNQHGVRIMPSVLIKSGTHRTNIITNKVFPLVKPYKQGVNGGFITVDASSEYGIEFNRIRVKVEPFNFEVYDVESEVIQAEDETDEEIIERIGSRFSILRDMAKATIAGKIKSLIVSGPPGVGKSYVVEDEIDKDRVMQGLTLGKRKTSIVKGHISALELYSLLYDHSDQNSLVVLDDVDSVFFDDTALNLLKGALDTGKKRKISWLSNNHAINSGDLPETFEFKGAVIFITNIKFAGMRNSKIKDHLEAIQSRSHIIDLTIDTPREKILRIKQIAMTNELFKNYKFSDEIKTEIIDYIGSKKDSLREISLRTAIKVADLADSFPKKWKSIADVTVCKN